MSATSIHVGDTSITFRTMETAGFFSTKADAGLRFRVFPGGAMLLTSALEVTEATEFLFEHDPNGIHISAQFFLSGEARILMGDGTSADWTQNGLSVVRSDSPGFRLQVQPGQTLRHVCVGMYHHALAPHWANVERGTIAALMATGPDVNLAAPVPPDPEIRAVAEQLYDLSFRPNGAQLKAESLAMGFLSDVLERFAQLDTVRDRVPAWQIEAAHRMKKAIDAAPGAPMGAAQLLQRFGLGEHMARRLFRQLHGMTLSAYLRRARLQAARAALMNGGGTVKQIAYDSGYAHIGNFTRAYRQAFGETPSETRRRSR